MRIGIRAAALAVMIGLGTPSSRAEEGYPKRPVKLVVGFVAGGGTDVLARFLGSALEKALGQQVVIENKPGATGTIAANHVAKASPDGYTLLVGTNASNAIAASVYSRLPFDVRKDLEPIALLAEVPQVISVGSGAPFKTLVDLLASARANPGKLSYTSAGYGSAAHLAGKLFEIGTETTMLHVPFKGAGQGITEVLAGRVDVSFDALTTILPFVPGGELRPLAVAALHRVEQLPDVPTTAEAGLPGYEIGVWYGLFGPAGLPEPILERVRTALDASLSNPTFREQAKAAVGGEPPMRVSSSDFAAFVGQEIDRYAKLVATAGLKPQ